MDETLMAYVDGELEAGAAAEVETAMARDPSVARRVSAWRTQRLRLRAAYDGVLHEPVPPRLAAAAEGVRSLRPSRGRWGLREVAAMAASVLLGALLSWAVVRQPGTALPGTALLVVSGEGLVAGSVLARALSEDLAGEEAAAPVRVGLSFRDRNGAYCRTFVLAAGTATAGLACRAMDRWQVQMVVPAGEDGESPDFRQAGSALPEAIARAVDARIEGEALGPEAERAARARGWTN